MALVVLSVLVGVIQVGSAGATFNFYDSAHRGNLIGFFANRNHEGVVLAVAAIFSIAFVHARAPSRQSALAWSAVLTIPFRSEARRVGKECGSPCRTRGSPYH